MEPKLSLGPKAGRPKLRGVKEKLKWEKKKKKREEDNNGTAFIVKKKCNCGTEKCRRCDYHHDSHGSFIYIYIYIYIYI
jgi:hypothetical protein